MASQRSARQRQRSSEVFPREETRLGSVASVLGTVVMLLVRLVRSNRKMEARLGEVIFNVTLWVAEIVSLCSGLQKLPGKEPGVAKAKGQSFIQLVFGDQIELVADVADGARARGIRQRTADVLAIFI